MPAPLAPSRVPFCGAGWAGVVVADSGQSPGMDWLARVPVVGPGFARLMRTRVWRAWQHYSDVGGDRFAAAVAYTGFVALFPLVAVTAAMAAAFLTPAQVERAENRFSDQFGFLSDRLDLDGLVSNAGTVGLVGAVWLLLSGLGWVDALRSSIRGVWRLAADQENILARKGKDLLVLLGLGGVLAVSLGGSALATVLVGQAADSVGLAAQRPGAVLLRLTGLAMAAAADFLLVVYLLRWLPGLHPRRRSLAQAALIGAVGFELLKLLLSGYLSGVAGKSMYGAFGTPVAVLLWMNFMARLLLFCAAWTATGTGRRRPREREVRCFPIDEDGAVEVPDGRTVTAADGAAAAGPAAEKAPADGSRPRART
ncbi:YihY/virulence factor BrkB family protein [Streptomyces capparidis]